MSLEKLGMESGKMDDIERIIVSAINKNLDGTNEKLDKIEEGVKNLIGENIALKKALQDLIEIIDAHELVSLSCDNDGQIFCECLDDAVKKAKLTLDKL